MKDKIEVRLTKDHIFNCFCEVIGRCGENVCTQLEITLDDCLCEKWVYLDFVKPDGSKYKTSKLNVVDNKVIYDLPNALLMDGSLRVQAVLQDETGEVWKSNIKTYKVISSINATDDIPEKEDFINHAQGLLEDIEEGLTPTIGDNGNWFVGNNDTGKPARGETGLTPNIKVGEVTTLEKGSEATVIRSGTNEDPVFSFGIPRGDDYIFTDEDKKEIVDIITEDANSVFNQNASAKTKAYNDNAETKLNEFNTNSSTKTTAFDNNATDKLKAYNDNAEASLKAYNDNSNAKVKEYDDNAAVKVEEYNSNANSKKEELNQIASDFGKQVEENTNDITTLETYLDNLTPKSSAKGELVHITDALPLPTFKTKSSGNVKQETTTGKNLFDVSKLPITLNGVTISQKPNGDVVLNGTPNITEGYIPFYVSNTVLYENLNTGYYTLSIKEKKQGIGVTVPFGGGTLNLTLSDTVNSKTINASTMTSGQCNVNVRYDVGTLNDFVINPQLEYNSTATEYEPYTNGATPRPNYPQEIEVLEGYNFFNSFIATQSKYQTSGELQIEKDGSFVVSGNTGSNNYFALTQTLGELCPDLKVGDTVYLLLETTSIVKNIYIGEVWANSYSKTITQAMLDKQVVIYGGYNQTDKIKIQVLKTPNKPYLPYGHIGYKVNGKNLFDENEFYKSNFNNVVKVENGYNFDVIKSQNVYTLDKVKTNTPYTFKGKMIGTTGANLSITVEYTDGTKKYAYETFGDNSFKITTDGTKTLKSIIFAFYNQGNFKNYTFEEFMLSENDDDYEPYQEQIVPLDLKGNWVGATKDAKDLLVTDKKKYWLVKNVNRGVISLTNTYGTDNDMWFFFVKPTDSIDYGAYTTNGFSEVCIPNAQNPIYFSGRGNINIYAIVYNKSKIETIPTIEELKELVDGKYFYYQLKEPQIIELGELPEPIKTFEGVNNIQLLANLDTNIEVKYGLDLKKYYDNELLKLTQQII